MYACVYVCKLVCMYACVCICMHGCTKFSFTYYQILAWILQLLVHGTYYNLLIFKLENVHIIFDKLYNIDSQAFLLMASIHRFLWH